MMDINAKKIITKKEACEYLQVSMGTLDGYMKQRDFPRLTIGPAGGRVLINRERLDKWIDDNTAGNY